MPATKTTTAAASELPRRTTPRPYHAVAESLRQRVRSGEWAPGSMMPGRRSLATEFGVALTTVERAVAALIAEGLLRADDRRGTFVAVPSAPAETAAMAPAFTAAPPSPHAPRPGVGPLVIISTLSTATPSLEEILPAAPAPGEIIVRGAAGAAAAPRIRSVLRGLESEYSKAGGLTRFLNRHQTGGWLPVGDTIRAALAEEPAAIAFVGIDEEYHVAVGREIVSALHDKTAGRRRNLPIVYISWGDDGLGMYHVYYDNVHAGYLAAEHLLFNGWRHLLYLDVYDSLWATLRRRGVEEAVLRFPNARLTIAPPVLSSDTVNQGHAEPQAQGGYHAARRALADHAALFAPDAANAPVGVIAPNDFAAFGALLAFQEADLAPGRDFALIGFDDLDQARERSLSSVRPPLEGLGTEAGRILAAVVRGEPAPAEICLGWHLSARASTAPFMPK